MNQPAMFTIIIPFRNRETARVENCLQSLDRQSFREFEVIFVDYGSDPEASSSVSQALERYSFCRYVHSESTGLIWSRAAALNAGIRLASGEYCMTTDVDMIFSQNYLETVAGLVAPDKVLYCQCFYLPRDFTGFGALDSVRNPHWELSRKGQAYGGCKTALTQVLKTLNGFDEHYKIWGVNDTDMHKRLIHYGLKEEWIDVEKTRIFHQWHPSMNKNNPLVMVKGWHEVEKSYMKSMEDLVRNDSGWGRVLTPADRPVLDVMRIKGESGTAVEKQYPVNEPLMEGFQGLKLAFDHLLPGECLRITYINENNLDSSWLARLSGRALNSLVWRTRINFRVNMAHFTNNYTDYLMAKDNVYWLILNCLDSESLEDYFVRHDENKLEACLMKRKNK